MENLLTEIVKILAIIFIAGLLYLGKKAYHYIIKRLDMEDLTPIIAMVTDIILRVEKDSTENALKDDIIQALTGDEKMAKVEKIMSETLSEIDIDKIKKSTFIVNLLDK